MTQFITGFNFEMDGVHKNILESVREDDFIEYFLFPPIENADENSQINILDSILTKANKIVESYTNNFLWHKDKFKLIPRTTNSLNHIDSNKESIPPHLYGITHFGDNIEDEWFIVFILQQLTKEITGLITRVYDCDGEFLLIEAADYIPSWANPESSENRVYIYDGKIHLVQPVIEEETQITVMDALSQIRAQPDETIASSDIQLSIQNKLKEYPAKIQENLHYTKAFIPVGIAAILKQKPNLISAAVQAFCNRDPIDLKACRAMKFFPPEDRVLARVKFTKCLYAMITNSKYLPDRRTGWNLPAANSKDYKAHSLGVKIACGFEILAAQAKPHNDNDVESDRGWHSYLATLKDKGYFKELLEHSVEYNNLLNKAKEYYLSNRESAHYASTIGKEILDFTKNSDYNTDELRKDEQHLPEDDDESWLEISPEELDKMLHEKYGIKKMINVNGVSDAVSFTENVTAFLNHVSDVDGAEFPTAPPRQKKKGAKVAFSTPQDNKNNDNNKVNFDPNSFSCAIQNILNFVIPEDDSWNLESDSDDMSEYEEDNYVKNETCEGVKSKMRQYMEEMDRELAATTIGESFEKKKDKNDDVDSTFDDIEDFKSVDIDVNALKNILESYKSQLGEAGPSSNLLGPMGIHLDPERFGSDAAAD